MQTKPNELDEIFKVAETERNPFLELLVSYYEEQIFYLTNHLNTSEHKVIKLLKELKERSRQCKLITKRLNQSKVEEKSFWSLLKNKDKLITNLNKQIDSISEQLSESRNEKRCI